MSLADDLLNTLSETIAEHEHIVTDDDSYFIIDPETRVIENTARTKNVIMQYDHDSERYTFELPRYVEGHDMSLCNVVKIHWNNIDGETGEETAEVTDIYDLQINPDNEETVICSWLISRNSTQRVGILSFLIQYLCVNDDGTIPYEWHTDIYSDVEVKKGRDNDGPSIVGYTDILEQWRARLFGAGDSVKTEIINTSQEQLEAITSEGTKQVAAITLEGEKQLSSITSEGEQQLLSITSEGISQIQAITAEGEKQLASVTLEGESKLAAIASEGTTQLETLTKEGESQLEAIKTEGEAQLENIEQAVNDTVREIADEKGIHVPSNDEIYELFKQFLAQHIVVSDTEPENGPVLWFDTTNNTLNDGDVVLLKVHEDTDLSEVLAIIDGKEYSVVNASSPVEGEVEGEYIIEVT